MSPIRLGDRNLMGPLQLLLSVLHQVVIRTFVMPVVRRSTELPFLEKSKKGKRRTFAVVPLFRVAAEHRLGLL